VIRLLELDPARVGALLRDRLASAPAEPRLRRRTTVDPPEPDALGPLAEAVTLYARHGLPVSSWTDRSAVADALARLLAALFDPDAHGIGGFLSPGREPDDELAIALLAALGRLELDRGQPVTARELAALAGVPTTSIRGYVLRGALRPAGDGEPDSIDPIAARAWLHGRGVPGFQP
jgi:hypothetical protein